MSAPADGTSQAIMKKQSTAINDGKRKKSIGFFGYIGLCYLVVSSLLAGVTGTFDAITLYRARTWPVVEAHLDRCTMSLHASKSTYYWIVYADWSYGSHLERHYSKEWTPQGSPRYGRHDPRADSDSERAAVTARYCNEAAIGKLRVSPGGTVRPDDEVAGATPVTDACISIFFLLIGFGVAAGLFYERSSQSGRIAYQDRRNRTAQGRRQGAARRKSDTLAN